MPITCSTDLAAASKCVCSSVGGARVAGEAIERCYKTATFLNKGF